MIKELVSQALIEHNFTKEFEVKNTIYYKRRIDNSIRYAVLHTLTELCTPKELNTFINKNTPEVFSTDPAFKKNCDLICIHQFKHLADFKKFEEEIFAIEEDPHFYKKYVLYYSANEVQLLDKFTYKDIEQIIGNKEEFNNYKDNPLTPSTYSVAAKIFIKLPFLELPFIRKELVPLRIQVDEAMGEIGLSEMYRKVQEFDKTNLDDFIKGLITHELENNKD